MTEPWIEDKCFVWFNHRMPLYSRCQVAMTPEYLLIPTPAKRQLLRSRLGMKHTLTSCWEPHSEERDCISLGFLCSLKKKLDIDNFSLLVISGILRLHNDLFGASAETPIDCGKDENTAHKGQANAACCLLWLHFIYCCWQF